MENFLLVRKKIADEGLIKEGFGKYFPDSCCIIRHFSDFSLYLYGKGDKFPQNYYENRNSFIGVVGTLFYNKLSYAASLVKILNDEISGALETDKLFGHFFIFIWNGSELKIYSDGSGIIKAYYDTESKYFCSSFLTLTEILGNLTINKIAVAENILTGSIIGEDTVINEIKGFESSCKNIRNQIKIIVPQVITEKPANRRKALDQQINILNNYFTSLHNFTLDHGADIGLTGGLDSRLLLGLALKNLNGYQVHSHWRSGVNKDLEIARGIANDLKIPFVSPEVIPWDKKNENDKEATFNQSLVFCDGQIRQHCYWHEEYNSVFYVKHVMNDKGLSLSGIGGEQYRDNDRFLMNCSLEKWLNYSFIGKFSGKQILKSPVTRQIRLYIKEKISKKLGFDLGKDVISLMDLKRITNEALIPSYRSIRINSMNRFSFCLGPFADHKLSQAAYTVIPFLNSSYNFEIDLIKTITPDLSFYRSTYGYSFNSKEPLLSYLTFFFLRNFIPARLLLSTAEIKRKSERPFYRDIENGTFIKKCIDSYNEIDLDLDTGNILQNPNTAIMAFSLGFLFNVIKSKLK